MPQGLDTELKESNKCTSSNPANVKQNSQASCKPTSSTFIYTFCLQLCYILYYILVALAKKIYRKKNHNHLLSAALLCGVNLFGV